MVTREFFDWYNNHHRHEGIAMLTPVDVHFGRSNEVLEKRQEAHDKAFEAHPECFVKGKPKAARLPSVVYINGRTKMFDRPRRASRRFP